MSLAAPAFLASIGKPLASALALVTVGVVTLLSVVWSRRRGARRRASLPGTHRALPGPMLCPSCQREFTDGLVYCPVDARKLVVGDDGVDRRTPGVRCPRCRRAFDASTRFCPLDAEELVAQAVWEATHPGDVDPGDDIHADGHACGKICPTCASKYGLDASFCGKDGSELVTVN